MKEYWWYLDAVPSHAWNRWRYHYPQTAYPYQDLIDLNARRNRYQPEYELVDTGVFDDGRYWITEVHYAKAGPDDLLMSVQITNVGPDTETIHVLPTAWFRNTWGWGDDEERPSLRASGARSVSISHPLVGVMELIGAAGPDGADPQAAVLRERNQHDPVVRREAIDPVPQGRHQRSCDGWRGHGQSGALRHQVRVLVPGHCGTRTERRICVSGSGRPPPEGAEPRRPTRSVRSSTRS